MPTSYYRHLSTQDPGTSIIQVPQRRIKKVVQLRYIVSPRYGKAFHGVRGSSMWTILGVDAADSGFRGGPFDSIMRRMGFDTNYWIAGHMLNQGLGGNGVTENFVPLTVMANRSHSTFENWIKGSYLNGVAHLNGYNPDPKNKNYDYPYWYGIYYAVIASRQMFYKDKMFVLSEPYCYAPSHITLQMNVVKVWKYDVLNWRLKSNRIMELNKKELVVFKKYLNHAHPLPYSVEIHNTEEGAGILDPEAQDVVVPLGNLGIPLYRIRKGKWDVEYYE